MRTFPESDENDVSPTDVLLQDYLDLIDPAFIDEDYLSSENNDGPILEDGFAEILESKYDKVTPEQIVTKCTHLTQEQCNDLIKLFAKFEKLFNRTPQKFTDKKIHLEVDPNVKPSRSCAYAVPHVH